MVWVKSKQQRRGDTGTGYFGAAALIRGCTRPSIIIFLHSRGGLMPSTPQSVHVPCGTNAEAGSTWRVTPLELGDRTQHGRNSYAIWNKGLKASRVPPRVSTGRR